MGARGKGKGKAEAARSSSAAAGSPGAVALDSIKGCQSLWMLALRSSKQLSLRHDPIEDIPVMRPVLEAAEKEADQQLLTHPSRGGLGFCHAFWETKKRILREKYRVDWRTPREMNPGVMFD